MDSHIISVDLGTCYSCVCSLNPNNPNDIKLNVNQASNRQTPSIIAFRDNEIIFAEEADGSLVALADNAVTMVPAFIGLTFEESSKLVDNNSLFLAPKLKEEGGTTQFAINFAGTEEVVHSTELIYFFIQNLLQVPISELPEPHYELVVAVHSNVSDQYLKDLGTCLSHLEGIKKAWAVSDTYASLQRWSKAQLKDYMSEITESHLGFLDVGFSSTTFFIAEIKRSTNEDSTSTFQLSIVAEKNIQFGTLTMIELISQIVGTESQIDVKTLPYKKRISLFKACNKCLKDLSISDRAKVEIECFLNDEDLLCHVTREQLAKQGDCLIEKTTHDLITQCLALANIEKLDNIELIGGGSRVLLVQQLLENYIPSGAKFRQTIHNKSCIAHGSLLALLPPEDNISFTSKDAIKEIPLPTPVDKNIKRITDIHTQHKQKINMLNTLESRILEIRSHKNGEFSDLISDEMTPLINQLEAWTWDSLYDSSITLEKIEEKLGSFEKKLEESSPNYVNEINRRNEEKRSREVETNEETTLSKEQLLKRAAKNKQEGNELFADGNVELSIQRYLKSLGYCSKVIDPTDDQKEELNDIKYACHLNLAQCYLKFDSEQAFNKAKNSCESALSIRETAKAYFRISVAYEKLKDFDKSLENIKKAINLENNKLFAEKATHLNKMIQARKEREKKVYSKMFG